MKKFVILSIVVGLAGIGVGIARRADSPAALTVAAAGEVASTSTVPAAAPVAAPPSTTATTRPASAAAKVTTTTRPRVATTTTTRSVTTQPTTTATVAAPTTTTTSKAACTLTAKYPSLEMGKVQTIRFESELVKPQVTFTMSRSGTIIDTYTSRTAVGSLPWTFVNEAGMNVDVTIRADVRPDGGALLTNLCSTTYRSLRSQ